jgi:hypothetical protein
VLSSIEHPANPARAAIRIVSATVSASSPKPFSRSALTGTLVAEHRGGVANHLVARDFVIAARNQ